jgi:hypothetical protein
VAYSPGGGVIATCTSAGYVQLWSASDYRQLAVLKLGGHVIVHDVAFSLDGRGQGDAGVAALGHHLGDGAAIFVGDDGRRRAGPGMPTGWFRRYLAGSGRKR